MSFCKHKVYKYIEAENVQKIKHIWSLLLAWEKPLAYYAKAHCKKNNFVYSEFSSFLQQKIRHLYKQRATKFLLYETSKPRKQTEKMSKQINRWRVQRVYKKNIEMPGISNGSHKKKPN